LKCALTFQDRSPLATASLPGPWRAAAAARYDRPRNSRALRGIPFCDLPVRATERFLGSLGRVLLHLLPMTNPSRMRAMRRRGDPGRVERRPFRPNLSASTKFHASKADSRREPVDYSPNKTARCDRRQRRSRLLRANLSPLFASAPSFVNRRPRRNRVRSRDNSNLGCGFFASNRGGKHDPEIPTLRATGFLRPPSPFAEPRKILQCRGRGPFGRLITSGQRAEPFFGVRRKRLLAGYVPSPYPLGRHVALDPASGKRAALRRAESNGNTPPDLHAFLPRAHSTPFEGPPAVRRPAAST